MVVWEDMYAKMFFSILCNILLYWFIVWFPVLFCVITFSVISVSALMCFSAPWSSSPGPTYLPAPAVPASPTCLYMAPVFLCSLPDCLCISSCVHHCPAFALVVCYPALLLCFWIFACSLAAIVCQCLTDYLCKTLNLSKHGPPEGRPFELWVKTFLIWILHCFVSFSASERVVTILYICVHTGIAV